MSLIWLLCLLGVTDEVALAWVTGKGGEGDVVLLASHLGVFLLISRVIERCTVLNLIQKY